MILVYDQEKAKRVLALFQQNQIVTLKVVKSDQLSNYIIEYTLITGYDLKDRAIFAEQFAKKDILQKRAYVLTLFEEFVNMMELGKVVAFELEFDLSSGQVFFVKTFDSTPAATKLSSSDSVISVLENMVSEQNLMLTEVPDLYEKSISDAGKKSKYVSITYGGLISKLKAGIK